VEKETSELQNKKSESLFLIIVLTCNLQLGWLAYILLILTYRASDTLATGTLLKESESSNNEEKSINKAVVKIPSTDAEMTPITIRNKISDEPSIVTHFHIKSLVCLLEKHHRYQCGG